MNVVLWPTQRNKDPAAYPILQTFAILAYITLHQRWQVQQRDSFMHSDFKNVRL